MRVNGKKFEAFLFYQSNLVHNRVILLISLTTETR